MVQISLSQKPVIHYKHSSFSAVPNENDLLFSTALENEGLKLLRKNLKSRNKNAEMIKSN
jgi:hypothetical protein